MTKRLLAIMCAALASAAACARPAPSADYERARALWIELVRSDPAHAAEAPRADEVLALLGRVPADGPDAAAAGELRHRIEALRGEAAAERERRAELLRRAEAPSAAVPVPVSSEPARGDPAGDAPRERAAPRVAPGLPLDDFRKAHGACFSSGGAITVASPAGATRPGELWTLVDEARCRESHPELVGRAVVSAEGVVATITPLDAVRRVEVRRDVQLAPLPDGRPGMVVDGRVVPVPPGAKVEPAAGGRAP